MELTPEIIEAFPKDDLGIIKHQASALHEATIGILETPMFSRDIERSVRLRTAMKLKIDEASGEIKGRIADLEAQIRELRSIKGWTTSDESRLESYMFERIREERKGNS